LVVYENILTEDEISNSFKYIIKKFLIPYKISFLKYGLNNEYFNYPIPAGFRDVSHIAPSLVELKKNTFDIALGYPNWFLKAFPDVAIWVMKGDGFNLIQKKFKLLSEDDLSDGNFIRAEILNEVIKLYLIKTQKKLECRNHNYK
jgi:hypothetical protein